MAGDEGRQLEGGTDAAGASAPPGSLLDRMRVAAFLLDTKGRVELWGPEAERLFGYSEAEALGREASGLLIHAEHLEIVHEWFRQVRAGAGWAGVFPVRGPGGETRRAEFRHRRLRSRDGRVHVLGLAVDADMARELETDLALSHSLVHQSPVGLALFDPELRWIRVNPALERINGLPATQLLGKRIHEALPGVDAPRVEAALRRVLETGEPALDQQVTGRTPADPDTEHAWSVSYYRVDDGFGRPLGIAASVVDISERERASAAVRSAREQLSVVADATVRIGTTLDLQTTAREVADVIVPRLADLAAVDVLDTVLSGGIGPPLEPDGSARFRALAVAAGPQEDPSLPGAADRVGELADYGPHRIVTRCVREARPIALNRLPGTLLRRVARGPEAVRRMRAAGVHAYLAVPLIARGSILGTISLARARGNPAPFGDEDVALAVELAGRAAICVDNARLYGRERTAALTLQRSLLPGSPRGRYGIDVAARYRPAVSDVGGDWYDVLPLGHRRVGLIVGDVMGKGIHAAAIMGQLRSATRALARLDLAPGRLLRHLDTVTESLGEDAMATCLYVVCDAQAGWCELASAGHLPPVLVRPGGTAELVAVPPGPPLGVGAQDTTTERRGLPPGATLALFTDGLVEDRRRAIDSGLRELLRLLAGPARPLEELCDAVLDACRGTPQQDDIALLLARVSPPPAAG